MKTRWVSSAVVVYVLGGLVACVKEVKVDANETTLTPPPSVIYDPANFALPTPTDLILDAKTGKLNVPASAGESALVTLLRTQGFNKLDGYSTVLPPIVINFSAALDAASLDGHVFLYRLKTNGVPADPGSEQPVPLVTLLAKPTQLLAFPKVPLVGRSVYAVALTHGITSGGTPVVTSGTFALLRQSTPPATIDANGNVLTNHLPFDPSQPAQLASIQQFAGLYKLTAPVLQYFDIALPKVVTGSFDRTQLIIAFPFHTQSISEALDQKFTGSAASQLLTASTALGAELTTYDGAQLPAINAGEVTTFVNAALGGNACGVTVDCSDIGEIHVVPFTAPNFQNPVNGVPGAWSDPLLPTKVSDATLNMLVVLPHGTFTDTVIFGHGLGGRKEDALFIAGQYAAAGYAVVAIDWVASGERAIQVSTNPALGCSAVSDYNTQGQCFAPIFSTDLLGTRDNFRQSVIDVEQEARVVAACSASASCLLHGGAKTIGYTGQSLGGLLGVMVTAMTPEIKASVINVGGAGWFDLATLTPDKGIKCSIVNGLIDAGILTGTKWDGTNDAAALCSGTAWLSDPNFLAFRTAAQWILDPADGLNYAARFLAPTSPKLFLQEVQNDQTVPNKVQDNLGLLANLPKTTANATPPPQPSAALASSGDRWIEYDTDTNFIYSHASLTTATTPADPQAASNGHLQLIDDAIAFLKGNGL